MAVAIWSALGSIGSATETNDSIVSNASVERTGLVVDWFTQIDVGAGQIVDVDLNISYFGDPVPENDEAVPQPSSTDQKKSKVKMVPENKSTVSFLIEYGRHVERISERDFDAYGKVLGIQGAEQQANLRKEIIMAELKARGKENVEVKITKLTLPSASIYALSGNGLVTAIDADSGKINWTAKIGEQRLPSIGLGSSSNHVAAINGSSIYCLDAKTGKLLWSHRCSSSPSSSPAVSEKFVYVPLIDGRIQVFPIKTRGVGVETIVTTGQALARPLITESTISWPSDKGYYTVAPLSDVFSPMYRLRSSDSIVAAGTYKGGLLFVNSVDGFVYAINEKKGSLNWSFSTGQQLSESPVTLGEYVYVITDEKKMFKIDARTGRLAEGWEEPLDDVGKYVGASEDKLYVLDSVGRVNIIEPNTGARLGVVASSPLDFVLPNQLSDRLYVGNRGGLIECIHEAGNQFPYFHSPEFGDQAKAKEESNDPFKIKDAEEAMPELNKDDDPFSGGKNKMDSGDEADPFGGSGDNTGKNDDEDPFGGGGGSKDKTDDNAGKGDDPFSGGGGDSQKDSDDDNPFGGGTP
jgi:outer membrane protein assembly factor BamB